MKEEGWRSPGAGDGVTHEIAQNKEKYASNIVLEIVFQSKNTTYCQFYKSLYLMRSTA